MKKINLKQLDKGVKGNSTKSTGNEKSVTYAKDKKISSEKKLKIEGCSDKINNETLISVTKSQKQISIKRNFKDPANMIDKKKMNENMSSENLSKKKFDQKKRPLSLSVKFEEKYKTITHANNDSFSGNNQPKHKYRSPIQTEYCDFHKIVEKTYENSAIDDEFLNTNHEELLITEPIKNKKERKKNSFIEDLEKRLDQSLKELKNIDQDSNYHKRKFTIVSSCFEDYINGANKKEESKLLSKLNLMYIEIIKSLIKENNDLRMSVLENEKITHKFNSLAKRFHDKCVLLEERNEELNQLRTKMKSIECKDESNLFDTKENMKENTNVDLTEINNHHNEIIKNINKSNIDDLEAIYFFDRVDGIRSKSVLEVPKLNLNFVGSKSNLQTTSQVKDNQKKLLKNKTLDIVKHINTSFKHDLIVNNKKTYVPVKNCITLTQNEVFFDSKNLKTNKPVTYSTKSSSSTSIKNELKKLHNNK